MPPDQSLAKRGISNRMEVSSQGDEAYDIIAAKILSGELAPSEKLSIRAMAALTGVSTIPVIEALHRLEHEGLVESFPRWGSRVVAMTPQTIRDRNLLREAIECQSVRLIAEMDLSKEQEARLVILAEELDGIQRTADPNNPFWNRHYDFHMELVRLTDSMSLEKALRNVSLFHLLQRNILAKSDIFSVIPVDLHTKIVRAILEKNPDKAEKAMRDHIRLSPTALSATSSAGVLTDDTK